MDALREGRDQRQERGGGERRAHRGGGREAPQEPPPPRPASEEQHDDHQPGRESGVRHRLRMAGEGQPQGAGDQPRPAARLAGAQQEDAEQQARHERRGHAGGVVDPHHGIGRQPGAQRPHPRAPRPGSQPEEQRVHGQQADEDLPGAGDGEPTQRRQGQGEEVERRKRRRLPVAEQRLAGPQLVRPQRGFAGEQTPAHQGVERQLLEQRVGLEEVVRLARLVDHLTERQPHVGEVGRRLELTGEQGQREERRGQRGVTERGTQRKVGTPPAESHHQQDAARKKDGERDD